jgi:hypothetical protein
LNGGTCQKNANDNEGTCQCLPTYSGTSCQISKYSKCFLFTPNKINFKFSDTICVGSYCLVSGGNRNGYSISFIIATFLNYILMRLYI